MKWTFLLNLGILCLPQLGLAKSSLNLPASGSHFKISVSGVVATITTTTPNRTYPNAGIKIITPGYTVSGNVRSASNGFYLFSVGDSLPASINILGQGGEVKVIICLDGIGQTYTCENQTISPLSNSHLIFATSSSYPGNLGGISGADSICQTVAYQSGSIIPYPGLTFKALLVTPRRYPCSSVNGGISGSCGGSFTANWPLSPHTKYVYADGITFFNTVNQYGVFDGTNSLIRTEQGGVPNGNFWMGIQSIFSDPSGNDIYAWAYTDMNKIEDGNRYTSNLSSCWGFSSNDSNLSGSAGLFGQIPNVVNGPISSSTWGNYFYFNNASGAYLMNVFSSSYNFSCSNAYPILCVS